MKKILTKVILFIGIIAIVIFTLNKIIPSESDSEKHKIDYILQNNEVIESLTFGRSHAASLDYKYWNKKGINLALGGRDLASINYQIQFLVPYITNLKEIIIFISYSSFYYDNEALSHGNLNDARKSLYYSIPSYKYIDKQDINNFIFGKFLPFIQSDHGYSIIKKYFVTNKSKNVFNVWENWNNEYMDSIEITKSAKKQALMHSNDRYMAEKYNPNVVKNNTQYLINIVQYLKSKNINCILVTSPYYKYYTSEFCKKDILEMDSIMQDLIKNYNVTYFNFSNDTLLALNNKYFHNADHLNDSGKKIFTEKLKLFIK